MRARVHACVRVTADWEHGADSQADSKSVSVKILLRAACSLLTMGCTVCCVLGRLGSGRTYSLSPEISETRIYIARFSSSAGLNEGIEESVSLSMEVPRGLPGGGNA